MAETLSARLTDGEIDPPRRCSKESLEHLLEYGGFPGFLVEVKTSERQLHAPRAYFQDATKADHAFQLV